MLNFLNDALDKGLDLLVALFWRGEDPWMELDWEMNDDESL